MNVNSFQKCFPLGSHLCREPMPAMSELKKDMENLKRRGFNLIKLQEHWAVDEPAEGQYDFSRYEELIAHAARLDLGVYLGLTCEQAPGWLWRKHPGCRMAGRSGAPIAYEAQSTLPADGKPGPCYDHAGARADMERFIKKLTETLGRFENIVIWNTWQEIGYWSEGLTGESVCYCANTLAFFRQWLQSRHGDLDSLNRAWNTRYAAWEDVVPDRSVMKGFCFPQEVAWRVFMTNVQIGRVLETRARAIREADPMKRPIFAHRGGPIIGSGQDWTYARCQDFLGSSCYPGWAPFHDWDDGHHGNERRHERHAALLSEMWNAIALRFDYIRSANLPGKPVWAAEFQGGPVVSPGFYKRRVPARSDMRRWMLTAVGSGVSAISFWVTRAEIMAAECNGFSLLDSEGETTERFEEAARVGAALNRHADIFGQPTWPGADVGILIDEDHYQFCDSMAAGGEHLGYSARGWHRILWEAGILVDFVEMSHWDIEHDNRHKVVILPFPLSLGRDRADKLTEYVERGGNLISEACPGRIEAGYCARGELSEVMRRLFGARHKSLVMAREPDDGARWSPPEKSWGEYLDAAFLAGCGPLSGRRLRANVYIETYECDGGSPILMYGDQVAGVTRAAGKGRAWLLGTFAGHNGTAYRDDETRACLRALLAAGDVRPEHDGKLLLRKRITNGKQAWLFTNPTKEDIVENIVVKGWRNVEDLFGESLKRDGDCMELSVGSLDVKVLMVSR